MPSPKSAQARQGEIRQRNEPIFMAFAPSSKPFSFQISMITNKSIPTCAFQKKSIFLFSTGCHLKSFRKALLVPIEEKTPVLIKLMTF
jgi:hypothetical protein